MTLSLKRVHDDADPDDGFRVLVDRLWPRGVSTERAALDLWLKDVAPSSDLRRWFDHRADRFTDFAERYVTELRDNTAVDELQEIIRTTPVVTLLYAAEDRRINHAVVLSEYLSPSA